jgi:hypothetical protein
MPTLRSSERPCPRGVLICAGIENWDGCRWPLRTHGTINLTLCADVSIGIGIRKRGSTFPVRFVLGLLRDRDDQDASVGSCPVDDCVRKPVHQVSACTVSICGLPQRRLNDSANGGLVLQAERFACFPIALPVPAARRSELQSCFWMDSKLIGRVHRSR